MKANNIISASIATVLLLLSGTIFAQTPDQNTPPDALIKMVVTDVMTSVKADPDIQKGNIPKVMELVEKKIVPFTDMRRTTEMAMGPNWKKATPEQQAILTSEFKTLLMRTYSGALSQLRDQTVQFKALRAAPDDKEVVVKTVVIGRGDPISLDYRLEKGSNGWKVYDMNIMGAWLVEAYRNQFANQISQNGIDGLVKFLQDRNKQLAATK
ncbi:ABC transporter substrate-binding protein [Polynucleobacter sp. 15G-AUS-farblos]|jgi:phospholipid transport system substrate-binding protein|uniref:MlaC/ttg2D family ABC transporter substrate-binding protein n=1 Tax=Polynucleobacter sp. 15G-AUS-farblos TaxID=2689094 RepID=UPI001C0B6B90|nr:ABC transporter substrate-binding protein [Polynucleobacter sp. 15G-AUS-farblos]MBU3583953.1 ABC transporter substrate-binding protein [Polynucleobacter sp. 15G-AUS-farblos]